jgi:cytochrome c-type biogenesis protein CcmH/NrfF
MSRKQTTLLGWLVPAAVLILLAAWCLPMRRTHRSARQLPGNAPVETIDAAPGARSG